MSEDDCAISGHERVACAFISSCRLPAVQRMPDDRTDDREPEHQFKGGMSALTVGSLCQG